MDNVLIKPVGPDAPIGPANALGRCLFRIGRSGNKPTFLYSVAAIINNGDPLMDKMILAGQIRNDLIKKWFIAKMLIVFLGDSA